MIKGSLQMLNKLTNYIKNYQLAKKYTNITYLPKADIHILARCLYPNGAWVNFDNNNIDKMSDQTHKLSWKYQTIYGGVAMLPSELYATADILYRESLSWWHIIEAYDTDVPQSEIVNDMAFKKFIFERCGFSVRKCIALKIRQYAPNSLVNIKDLFDAVDVTQDVVPTFKQFQKITNQDISLRIPNEVKFPKSDEIAYIDYSCSDKERNDNWYDCIRPSQTLCRVLIDGRVIHFKQYLRRYANDNIQRSLVDFLIRQTEKAEKVYVRNYEFEQAHHRQMARMFPDKANMLQELNDKLLKWSDYIPLPELNAPKIADELAEFRTAYKQRHKKWCIN